MSIQENSVVSGRNGQRYTLGAEIGAGGEGRVFKISGQNLVGKIYKKVDPEVEKKIRYMVQHPIADLRDTTPEYLLGKTDRKSKPHISEEYLKLIEEREAHTALVMGFGGDRQIIEVPEGAEEVILATIEAWRKKQAEENDKNKNK